MMKNGLVTIASAHSAKETIDRFENDVKSKGMTIFARIDHAAGAKAAGMALRPTELLIHTTRHCEQSEAIHCSGAIIDCFVPLRYARGPRNDEPLNQNISR